MDHSCTQSSCIWCSGLHLGKSLLYYVYVKNLLRSLVTSLVITVCRHNYNCHPQGRQKLLNSCVSIGTEARKICKAWVLINQILPLCFCSYGLLLKKSIHRVKEVDISEPTDINQSISMKLILSNRSVDFHPGFFVFP